MKLLHTISQATGPSVLCENTSFTVIASNLLLTEDFILSSLQCCVKTVLGTFILKVFVSPFCAHFHVIICNKQSKKQNHMCEYNNVKLKLNNFLCHIETEATFFPLSMLPCLDSLFYFEKSENAQETDTGCLFLIEVSLSLLIVTQP